MLTYAEDLERMQNANEIKTLKARSNRTQIALYQKQHLSHCLTQTQEKFGGEGGDLALFMLSELDSAFRYGSVWGFLYLHLNGVFDGSYRALCLSRAGPGASSWRGVEMYLGGGPPKICSLFCSTCSQRCSVFNAAWQRGEEPGRSGTELQMYKKWGGGWWRQSVCWESLPNRSYPAIGKNDLRLTNTSWTIAKRIKHQLCERIKWIWRKVWMCSAHKLTHRNRSTGLL